MGHGTVLTRRRGQEGQAIIMVTLALVAMCGILGLAVDFGWAYFVKRAAQAAADQAALTAVTEMRRIRGAGSTSFACLTTGGCATDFVCDNGVAVDTTGTQNLDNACRYAAQAGFQEGGRQRVRIVEGSIADGTGTAPTLPGGGFPLQYWATVRVTESVPQLFSAIMGTPVALVSARATAGIYLGQTRGSIILLNRNLDTVEGVGAGANLAMTGNANLEAGGGIFMASSCAGNCGGNGQGTWAGQLGGNQSSVDAPFTLIRGNGWVANSNGTAYQQPAPGTPADQIPWDAHPQNGGGNGPEFRDPTESKTQVPVNNGGLADCPIPNGLIGGADDGQGPWYLGPGNYYSTSQQCTGGGPNRVCETVADGARLTVAGNVKFVNTGTCVHRGGSASTSTFGTHVLFGGMRMQPGSDIAFDPGKIVLAGAPETQNGRAGVLMDISVGGSEASLVSNSDANSAGNIFIFTAPDVNYPGLVSPTMKKGSLWNSLKQGRVELKTGQSGDVLIDLDGLNSKGNGFPADLENYDGTVFWQDRKNSFTSYTDDGKYNCSGPDYVSGCTKSVGTDKTTVDSPELAISAGALTGLHGVIYQPRGAWATLSGTADITSALQIITGAFKIEAGTTVRLVPVTTTMPRALVALVE